MLAIIIPYFKLEFFEETLSSLANQTNKEFKVYIGNDASPEDCSDIIEKYKQKIDLVYHNFESNLGSISLIQQWERCIELSKNEKWLMLLGDDDILGNNVVEEFYNFIESNDKEIDLIRFNLNVIDENGDLKSQLFDHEVHETSQKLLDQMLLMKETITASEFIFSRNVYNRNNGFVEFPLAWFSDYATWLVFSKNTGVFYIKNALVYWRLSQSNISSVVATEKNIQLKIKSLFLFMYFLQINFNIERKRLKDYTHAQLINFFGNISDFVKIRILRKEFFKFRFKLADIIILEFIFDRIKRKKNKKFMEVFVPHLKDRNIYLDEIICFSDCNFIFSDFNSYKNTYKIVNIHFPEAIFNWIVPTDEQLNDLEQKILDWKRHSKIIYTLNDIKSHYDEENKFADLFRLVQKHADGVIHLGNYSLEKYKHLFSVNCQHTVIYHPLYDSLIADFAIADFQEKFQLNLKDKYVVSVIGDIRSMEEVKLIFKVFNKIPHKNKFLIVPNMFVFMKLPKFFPYRFRNIYRRVEEFLFCFPLRKEQYFFNFKFIDYNYMVDLVKNSSLVVIPRLKNLNSGNLYLGLSFDKPMIIPKVGNLTETADYFNFPLLDLQKKNYEEVIDAAMALDQKAFFKTKEYLEKKDKFKASTIAAQYDAFFYQLINN